MPIFAVSNQKRKMMLYKLIPPSAVKATVQLPASKSISNRALIINALGKGIYPPENLSDCDDTQVMVKALTEGKETIDIMAAGTAMQVSDRLFERDSGRTDNHRDSTHAATPDTDISQCAP